MKCEKILFLIFICFSFEFKSQRLIRKLDNTDDDSSDSGSYISQSSYDNYNETVLDTALSDEISNQTYSPTVDKSLLVLIAIGNYHVYPPPNRRINFIVYFKAIIGTYILPIRMTLIVRITYYYRLLRYLEEKDEIANCERFTYNLDPDIKYNCSFPVPDNATIDKVTSDGDFKFDGMFESIAPIIIMSSLVNETLKKNGIQSTEGEDLINKTYYLMNNTILEENGLKFKLTGEMDKKFPENQKVVLMFDEKGNGNIKNATCIMNNIENQIYELNCRAEKSINANLNAVNGITISQNPEKLIIYMKPGSDDKLNTGNNNMGLYSRGSSSGLSGGAIAGIVITCVIALICITIGIMICRKSIISPPFQESAVAVNTNNVPVQESSFGVYNSSTLNNLQSQYPGSTVEANNSNVTG